jgi:hypothetical protein
MFEAASDAALIDTIAAEARASAVADARKYGAIAELERRRNTGDHANWACDDWDSMAAEVAAALNIGHGRAISEVDLAVTLRDRLPKVAALFLSGVLNGRRVWLIDQRTNLITDAEALAAVDSAIADRINEWGPLSEYKLTQALDVWVDAIDPGAVRRTRYSARSRDFTIGEDRASGTTPVWGRLFSTDAALLRERLDAMARMVCEDDPRTLPQRLADALGALAAGSTCLSCQCERPDCPSVVDDGRASSIVVHVVAEQESTRAETDIRLHGEGPTCEQGQETPDRKKAALIVGQGIVLSPLLAEIIARGAKLRPLISPRSQPEPHYRPSRALDESVRLRDLTCRAPGCDRPAMKADIDHTIPYPAGATHFGNLKCYCRPHHLLKTFFPGWSDRQLADGTVIVTTPTGHTYTTRPGSSLYFPTLTADTPAPPCTPVPPSAHRTLMMPKRKRTRSQSRADRIKAARALNDAHVAERNKPSPF